MVLLPTVDFHAELLSNYLSMNKLHALFIHTSLPHIYRKQLHVENHIYLFANQCLFLLSTIKEIVLFTLSTPLTIAAYSL